MRKPKKITQFDPNKKGQKKINKLSQKEMDWIRYLITSGKYTFKEARDIIMETYNISRADRVNIWVEKNLGISRDYFIKEVGEQTNVFNFLKDEDINFIKETYENAESREKAQEIIAKTYSITNRTVRKWVNKLGIVGNKQLREEFEKDINRAKERKLDSKMYIITWGQQSTPVHKKFFKNILCYASFLKADVGVIVGRYKNPTSIFKKDEDDNWFDPLIKPYLIDSRQRIQDYVSVLADIKIQPTAVMPLTGFEGFEAGVSCILGHPRVHMKVVPALEGYRKKQMWTTGSCTLPNYTDSKAGKKGNFHHTYGFVVIETKGDEFYIRQVTANDEDGSFIDICYETKNGKTKKIEDSVETYCVGDSHFLNIDTKKENATKKYISKLNPNYVRLDDVFDGSSVNPHEKQDPITRYHKASEGLTLQKELDHLKKSLKWYSEQRFKVIIPRCNHDIFLDRYILDADWKKDIINARTYVRCAALLMDKEAPKGLIPYFIQQWYSDFICLNEDDSFQTKGFEMSVHGHRGANGSKGGHLQFKRFSTKMVTQHTHSPLRIDGVVTGGTSTKERQDYMKGASNHLQCDVIVTKNGKAQQLIFNNYKCTTFI